MANTKQEKRARVKRGIRKKISGTAERPRLSVFRSNRHIYAQLIDDRAGKTLSNIEAAWVQDQSMVIENGKIKEYRVALKLTFILKD